MAKKKKKEEAVIEDEPKYIFPRIILGLDISTSCIGACIVKDDGISDKPEILDITHKTPKLPKNIKKGSLEALFIRKKIFEDEYIKTLDKWGITDVVIEEPLLLSNNAETVATLLRFNGMISDSIYEILGIIPNFISSYDARMYSFPELVALRKYNKKGEEYPLQHIKKAITKDKIVLFGSYPFDIDKKYVMMNKINELYCDKEISWVFNKKGEMKKENFDACDSLVCALAYVNINRYGIEKPIIKDYNIIENTDGSIKIEYITSIWNTNYSKILLLNN